MVLIGIVLSLIVTKIYGSKGDLVLEDNIITTAHADVAASPTGDSYGNDDGGDAGTGDGGCGDGGCSW